MLEQFGSRSGSNFFVKNSEYDQKIPQSQTKDKPMAPRGRATPGGQTKQSNQLSLQIQIVLTFQAIVRPSVYSQIGHLLASFLFYVESIWLNMTST